MITAIVGHRGTGKSELFQRLRLYVRDDKTEFFDLDLEIAKKTGKSIREIFLESGEKYFRQMEHQVFLELLQSQYENMYLVLGAGFDLSLIPEKVRVLWVKRVTDLDGRIFLNRPRLEPELPPLVEFKRRAEVREKNFHNKADSVYIMPEGQMENHLRAMEIEKQILLHEYADVGASITILPEVMGSERKWSAFKERFSEKGISFFELRDDLLSPEQIQKSLDELSGEKFIFSLRSHRVLDASYLGGEDFKNIVDQVQWIDLAWEVAKPSLLSGVVPKEKLCCSLHEMTHFAEWSKIEPDVAHLKFAPIIESFSELDRYHQWQKESPRRRSFLPRSQEGRWSWYRVLQKHRQLINFVREDGGSAGDQPSLFHWLMPAKPTGPFAAVLGDPVRHSYTPIEHSDFFHKKQMPVFAIQIRREEWAEALSVITKMGLTHAAVTAPHKENAAQFIQSTDLKALNTLILTPSGWRGTSTDEVGFLELIEGVGMIAPLQKEIFIWGGGGVLEMIQKQLPHATYFSSRAGLPREISMDAQAAGELSLPKVVIWAAPRDKDTKMPPPEWNPAMVLDLNYKEDSMGKEYAQRCGANYISGLGMFVAQAQGQRVFWRKAEEPQ